MKRRHFLRDIGLLSLGWNFLNSCRQQVNKFRGKITGASAAAGHILRDGVPSYTIANFVECKVVVAGAGVSGLSAARELSKNNINDYILVELEQGPGGNAGWSENEVSQYPLGAHYIPTPNNDCKEYLDFLKEAGVITAFSADGLPEYNEYHLCFDSQERLYINGRWQEGLVPANGLQQSELDEVHRFLQLMDAYRYHRGADGKYAFDIPVSHSSTEEAFLSLDNITMEQWLRQNKFSSKYLDWYVNYCTRDDFGTAFTDISAWAGIHYFAARKGKGVNAVHSDVLTWPEGNGFLVKALMKNIHGNIHSGCMVLAVKQEGKKILVDYMHLQSKKVTRISAEHCIIATPQYVAARLINDKSRIEKVHRHFQYTPWLVANIKTSFALQDTAQPMSWDNVWFNSDSLGYVVATHQLLQQQPAMLNITYYLPFTNGNAAEERKKLQRLSYESLCEIILSDIEKVHPGIQQTVSDLNIHLWGHSMVKPLPGIITGNLRQELGTSLDNRIHFANADLSGISIFEEAFYQGITAANKIISMQ